MSQSENTATDYIPPSKGNDDEPLPDDIVWTPQEAAFTKLFQAWDNLPLYNPATETTLLRELDSIITRFEAYIHHSDAGFMAWVKRHQRAMELGLAEVPHWRKLYRRDKTGDCNWKDDEWVKRYSFLVHQRDVIAKSRLAQVTCCSYADKCLFFGRLLARPRQTLRTVGKQARPARMPARWYCPLDRCLEAMVLYSLGRLDLVELRCQFWGEARPWPAAPVAADTTVGCEARSEIKEEDEVLGGSVESPIWIA